MSLKVGLGGGREASEREREKPPRKVELTNIPAPCRTDSIEGSHCRSRLLPDRAAVGRIRQRLAGYGGGLQERAAVGRIGRRLERREREGEREREREREEERERERERERGREIEDPEHEFGTWPESP